MTVRLSRKLVLEERQNASDGAGGLVGSWIPLGTHWASVVPRTGRLERGDGYARSRVPYDVMIRSVPVDSSSRPKAGQRFREGTRLFKIRSVSDATSDARFLICRVDEEVVA